MPSGGRPDGERIAIVREQDGELGGIERVIACVEDRYPRAATVTVSRGTDRRRHFLTPIRARRLRAQPFPRVDVALSFPTSGSALAVPPPLAARHVAYVCGPPRALYGHTRRYLTAYPPPLRLAITVALPALRAHIARLFRAPDRLVTISAASADALYEVFGLHAEVVHPPARTAFFTPRHEQSARHVLAVARLVPHKRIDSVVDAFNSLDQELVVVGDGPCLEQLRRAAPSNVRFTGRVSDEELRELYRRSSALVSPSVEEFGLAMAEAQSCGVPVIAPRQGGALEIVRDGVTGILLDRADPPSIAAAVAALRGRRFDAGTCRASAERFAEDRFVARMERIVDEELAAARTPREAPAPRTVQLDLREAPAAPH